MKGTNFIKKLTAAAISATVLTSVIPSVYAYKFPNSFWSVNDAYEAAVSSGDTNGIISNGLNAVSILENEEKCSEVISALTPRYDEIAKAYASYGMYDASADMYEKYIPYAEMLNWSDGVKIAKAKIAQYRSDIKLFTDDGADTYFGAKNEPQNGVLFGVCADGEIRDSIGNESMILLYQEINQSVSELSKTIFKKAADEGIAIEVALNCPNESYDIDNIASYTSCLDELSALFAENPSAVVYLRFGAEFDVWTAKADPGNYIYAYQTVSSFFKSKNSNVAMVWSPNQVSSWDINIDDYYPGDEYVDWVGMSLYSQRYFLGNNAPSDDFSEVVFKTGVNADPVIAVRDIAEKYGSRKPIMLSESGSSHYYYNLGEDTSTWALQNLKEVYNYLPMVYPQIKLIAYFDKYVNGEIHNFSLSANQSLKDEYIRLTKGARFIQNKQSGKTEFRYRELTDNSYLSSYAGLYTYAHIYGQTIRQVDYYIDGNLVSSSYEMPFNEYIDLKDYANGTHTVKAVAYGDGGGVYEKSIAVNVGPVENPDIKVVVNGSNVEFTQPPFIYNNRTMVPMRAIFESLGAEVSWDNSSRTAIGVKDGKTVSISIGSAVLYVNGAATELDTPAILAGGSTLVPARAIAEAFDCNVEWSDAESTVIITN